MLLTPSKDGQSPTTETNAAQYAEAGDPCSRGTWERHGSLGYHREREDVLGRFFTSYFLTFKFFNTTYLK